MSYVVTDIETVADPNVWDPPGPELPKLSDEKPPSRADLDFLDTFRDRLYTQDRKLDSFHPEDIEKARRIAEKTGRADLTERLAAAAPERTPLPPIYACRPIVIGCAWLDDELLCKKIGAIEEKDELPAISEPRMLREWSEFMDNGKKIVSWFGRGFDLPVLTSRAFLHGVPLSWYFDENYRYRYSEDKHVDLCDVLSNFGAVRSGIKLDGFSRLCGLPGKPGIDGSMVGKMYDDGKRKEIVAYCLTDVIGTIFCFLRWKRIKGCDLEKYQAAVDSVFAVLEGMELHPIVSEWLGSVNPNKVALRT
jgi:hypothetical protein